MDKYKRLISNTAIFAIGTFSSKVLVYLMMPLYTRVLTTGEYGITDLVVQTGNLMVLCVLAWTVPCAKVMCFLQASFRL